MKTERPLNISLVDTLKMIANSFHKTLYYKGDDERSSICHFFPGCFSFFNLLTIFLHCLVVGDHEMVKTLLSSSLHSTLSVSPVIKQS